MSTTSRSSILVRTPGVPWRSPDVRAYDNEAHLQALLAEHPELLPGVQEEAAAVTELLVPDTGYVDLVVLDRHGTLTLVECKLASNPEIRRTVTGQVLAYASGLWKLPVHEFEKLWTSRHPTHHSPTDALGIDEDEVQGFQDALSATLEAGSFQLVVAVDEITDELRRVIEFTNSHTDERTTIVAVELNYARVEDVEILLPRVFGSELAATKRVRRAEQGWNEEALLAAIAKVAPEWESRFGDLMEHFRPRLDRYWYGQGTSPSVTAVAFEPKTYPFSIWASDTVSLSINFEYMLNLGRPVLEQLAQDLTEIPEIKPIMEKVVAADFRKRPGLKLHGVLDQPGVFDRVVEALDKVIQPGPSAHEPK